MKIKVSPIPKSPHPEALRFLSLSQRRGKMQLLAQVSAQLFGLPLPWERGGVRRFLGVALLFLFLNSCSDDAPLLDPTPKITLKEIAPTTIVQFTDSISMVIEYEDGDGDVGYWSPDSLPLTVHDLRLANPDYFYVRPLTPDSNALAITGTIHIAIRNTFLLGNGDSETTRYEIKLKDRAGHWSNVVTTPEVTITR